jgi:hypothetical protein
MRHPRAPSGRRSTPTLDRMSSTQVLLATAAASAASGAPGVVQAGDTWEKALLTLLGTFVGASLAFLSQVALQRRQERKAELLAAHRILFCLLQQTNTIVLFQKDHIAPKLESPVKFIEVPASSEFDLSKNLFDFSTFGFLLKSRDGRQIMYDLYLAQESYVETLRMINDRSRMHRELLQPKLAEAGLGNGKAVVLNDLPTLLGSLVYGTMVNSTDQILSLLQSSFKKLAAVKTQFRAFAVKYFRTTDFTDFDFPETHGLLGAGT